MVDRERIDAIKADLTLNRAIDAKRVYVPRQSLEPKPVGSVMDKLRANLQREQDATARNEAYRANAGMRYEAKRNSERDLTLDAASVARMDYKIDVAFPAMRALERMIGKSKKGGKCVLS